MFVSAARRSLVGGMLSEELREPETVHEKSMLDGLLWYVIPPKVSHVLS